VEKAKISEIFLSFQGEGPFAGSRQLFVRFYGCNRSCSYCDTFLESYKSFTKDSLMGRLLGFTEDYNEIVLTGGEPLLWSGFLVEFLDVYKKHWKNGVYLETNGTLPGELEKVVDKVDIISMDIKLPSSTGDPCGDDIWDLHRRFVEVGSAKKMILKAVVTDMTLMEDMKAMSEIIARANAEVDIVLQPVTPVGEAVKQPDGEMLLYFKKYLEKETGRDIMVLGQLHKCLGVK